MQKSWGASEPVLAGRNRVTRLWWWRGPRAEPAMAPRLGLRVTGNTEGINQAGGPSEVLC